MNNIGTPTEEVAEVAEVEAAEEGTIDQDPQENTAMLNVGRLEIGAIRVRIV